MRGKDTTYSTHNVREKEKFHFLTPIFSLTTTPKGKIVLFKRTDTRKSCAIPRTKMAVLCLFSVLSLS